MKANEKRAFEIFSVIHALWEQERGVFHKIVLPEARIVESIANKQTGENLARILFAASIFMRGGIISDDPLKMFPYLLENHPALFVPEVIKKFWSMEKIAQTISEASVQSFSGPLLKINDQQQLSFLNESNFTAISRKATKSTGVRRVKTSTDQKKIYKVDEFSKAWKINFDLLADAFDGQVLKMYEGVTDFEQLYARVGKPIFGMRRKILALCTIWLQTMKLVPHFPCPLPVDFHALRILFATQIFSFSSIVEYNPNYPEAYIGKTGLRVSDKLITDIMKWSQGFMTKHGFNHMYLNPAIWVLSRELCAFNHQNKSFESSVKIIDAKVLEAQGWPKKYVHPCLSCPIEKFCKFAIPSGPYYKKGVLLVSDHRVNHPSQTLSGLHVHLMPMRQKRNNRN